MCELIQRLRLGSTRMAQAWRRDREWGKDACGQLALPLTTSCPGQVV